MSTKTVQVTHDATVTIAGVDTKVSAGQDPATLPADVLALLVEIGWTSPKATKKEQA